MNLRERARKEWRTGFSLLRFRHGSARPGFSPARPARHRAAARLITAAGEPTAGHAGSVLAMTDLDNLDALSSIELHDLAVHRARHHLDVAFLWELLRALPAGEAIAGRPEHSQADAMKLSALIADAMDTGESDVADALRPLYLDYLNKHREDLPGLEHHSSQTPDR